MSTPGLLYVSMQPREGLSLDQFHEWYNNEHGPTRLRLPQIFPNGLRYRAADGETPGFVAVYDVTCMSHLETETYTTLRANRSPREAATIGQVDVQRSFWDLLHTEQGGTAFRPFEAHTDGEAEGLVTVAAEITLTDAEGAAEGYRTWYEEEHAKMLSKVPGWVRSRLYRTSYLEGGKGTPSFLALHDYKRENGLGGPEHKASMSTSYREEVFGKYVASKGRRTWSLFYVFGPAPRDLSSLSRLPADAAFTSADGKTVTNPGSDANITSHFNAKDGLSISYRLEGNSSPDAPVVAFVNSLLTSYQMWDPFVAILKKERPDLKILRYDFRGRNAIPQPPVAATLDRVTDDLIEVLDALRIPKVAALIGVSMGGATTLNAALRYPDRMAKFIACDFNATSSAANTQAWKDRIAVAQSDDGAGIKTLASQTVARWFHPSSMEKADGVSWMTDMVATNDVEGFAHSCTALWDYDLKPALSGCRVPGLFVVGEGDGKGALVKAMDGFRGQVGEGGVDLNIVPEAGHLPMCEAPQGFWEAVRSFV